MDFPDNAKTNVHKIVGISSVRWALYSLEDFNPSDRPNKDQSQSPANDAFYFLNVNQTETHQNLDHELRSRGYHVLYDTKNSDLWIFDLKAPVTSTAHNDNSREILRIMDSSERKYKKVTTGSLDATDLCSESTKTPNHSPSYLKSAEKVNSQVFGVNSSFSKHDSDEHKKSSPYHSLYDFPYTLTKMIEAVSLSVSYDMTKNLSYFPLSSRSFIKSRLIPSAPSALTDEKRSGQFQSELSILSILIRWWPSGVLSFSDSHMTLPGLRRVLDYFDDFQASQSAETMILFSPSGQMARYLGEHFEQVSVKDGEKEDSDGRILKRESTLPDSLARFKSTIMNRLTQLGIHLPMEEVWLRLEYVGHRVFRNNSEGWLSQANFVWPASLCFYTKGNEYQGNVNSLSFGKSNNNDPLADAELWFDGKKTRHGLMETAKRQDKMINKIKEEPPVVDQDDSLSDFVPRANQYIGAHDVNSIYPTPPDGLRTQAVSSSNPEANAPPSGLTDRDVIVGSGQEGTLTGSPFMGSLDPLISSAVYEPPNDTDLFDEIDGEMDNELFADNILTEADFSFFDGPNGENNMDIREDEVEASIDEGAPNVSQKQPSHDVTNEVTNQSHTDLVESDNILAKRDLPGSERILSGLTFDENAIVGAVSSQKGDSVSLQKPLKSAHRTQNAREESMSHIDDIIEIAKEDHQKSFQSISFKNKLKEFDIKYLKRGRFGYESEDDDKSSRLKEPLSSNHPTIPRISLQYNRSTQISKKDTAFSDLESDNSEDGSSSHTTEPPSKHESPEATEKSSVATSRKRKRDQTEMYENPATPVLSDYSKHPEIERLDENVAYLITNMLNLSTGLFDDSSLSIILQDLRPKNLRYSRSDRPFIQIAQLLVEQLVLQTEFTTVLSDLSLGRSLRMDSTIQGCSTQEMISRLFPKNEQCSLINYIAIEKGLSDSANRDIAAGRPSQRDQPLPSKPKLLLKAQPNIIKLPAPFTCIRRNQTPMDILAPALYFWEELGLGPSHGDKDVVAICVCPAIDSIQQGAETFLSMLGSAYQSCKLGDHTLAPDSLGYSKGIVPVPITDSSFDGMINQFHQVSEKLGTNIGHLNAKGGNTVIYIINPFKSSLAIPYLCAASLKIFESYTVTLKAKQTTNPNDLVLQIVPLSLVFSSKAIVLPSPLAYRRLAFEVYDRCPPTISSDSLKDTHFTSAPSVKLARAIPKMINLTLSSEPTASSLQSDMCFHLAYAWDPTQEWLTVSWTDNQGDVQWNTPYCLGVREVEDCWLVLSDIIKEIWETTLEMLYPRNSPWRLFVAKDSPMHKRELEAWLSVCMQPSVHSVTCTFLTIDSNPSLQFPPPLPAEKPPLIFSNAYNTPGSTPAAQTVSPDASGLISTPGGNPPNTPTTTSGLPDADMDARLVDILDDSWSLILPTPNVDHLLPQSLCPALASGYLLKRAGTRDEDGLLTVGVDIVHGDAKGREAVLRDVISMYRDLAALARLRGVVDRVMGVLPWHVAAARRAGDGVNLLMSWGEG